MLAYARFLERAAPHWVVPCAGTLASRLENGKVVEQRDVIQEISVTQEIPVAIFPPINDNGLF